MERDSTIPRKLLMMYASEADFDTTGQRCCGIISSARPPSDSPDILLGDNHLICRLIFRVLVVTLFVSVVTVVVLPKYLPKR